MENNFNARIFKNEFIAMVRERESEQAGEAWELNFPSLGETTKKVSNFLRFSELFLLVRAREWKASCSGIKFKRF